MQAQRHSAETVTEKELRHGPNLTCSPWKSDWLQSELPLSYRQRSETPALSICVSRRPEPKAVASYTHSEGLRQDPPSQVSVLNDPASGRDPA